MSCLAPGSISYHRCNGRGHWILAVTPKSCHACWFSCEQREHGHSQSTLLPPRRQPALSLHLSLHRSSRRREVPTSPSSHLSTPCRCPVYPRASWMALGTHLCAAEPSSWWATRWTRLVGVSGKIQPCEHGFLILLYESWPPHATPRKHNLCRSSWPHQGVTGPWVQATEPDHSLPSQKGSLDTLCWGRLLHTDTHTQVSSSGDKSRPWFSRGKLDPVFPNSNAFSLLLRSSQICMRHQKYF